MKPRPSDDERQLEDEPGFPVHLKVHPGQPVAEARQAQEGTRAPSYTSFY